MPNLNPRLTLTLKPWTPSGGWIWIQTFYPFLSQYIQEHTHTTSIYIPERSRLVWLWVALCPWTRWLPLCLCITPQWHHHHSQPHCSDYKEANGWTYARVCVGGCVCGCVCTPQVNVRFKHMISPPLLPQILWSPVVCVPGAPVCVRVRLFKVLQR